MSGLNNLATDPTLWSTVAQASAIHARSLGSLELLNLQIDRIERLDSALNAVCTRAYESARNRSRQADDATAKGESWGALHGIPVTIKDAIATAGIRSTGGAVELRDHVPTDDAPAVRAVKDAGAIVFGKTNLPRWSGEWQAFNEMFGTTNNPWDLSRSSGGSSGGAAAAVATGMTSFEIGTDIGGSVRVPSAMCGVYGHKPSFGVVPTLGYLDEPNGGTTESDVNVFGPITRSADDLSLLFDILAQPTPDRASAWRLRLPTPEQRAIKSLAGLRVGVWFEDASLPSDRAMLRVLEAVVPALEHAGARIDPTTRPAFDTGEAWVQAMHLIGAACGVSDDNQSVSHTDWLFADRARARARAAWADYFEQVDVLLCPVAIAPAFPHTQNGSMIDRTVPCGSVDVPYFLIGAWTSRIGAAYLPSTSAPVGRTTAGLPVGVQVVSPYLHDRSSIAIAGWLTELVGGYVVPEIVG